MMAAKMGSRFNLARLRIGPEILLQKPRQRTSKLLHSSSTQASADSAELWEISRASVKNSAEIAREGPAE